MKHVIRLALSVGSASVALVLSTPASAQPTPAVASRASDVPRRIVRIDGKDVPKSMQLAAELPSTEGHDGPLGILTAPSPAVLMDGWSHKTSTVGSGEDYDFTAADDVQLTFFVKVPETGIGGSAGESFDVFLVPCGTLTIPPRLRTILFVDDVVFPPLAPFPTVRTFFFTITLTAAQVGQVFTPGTCVDWFVAADFDATNNPDVDGNGVPDCCVESRPVRFIDLGSPTVDVIGSDVLRFFNPGHRTLNIFAPHPPLPAAKAIGGKPGEDGSTRPWCFQIQ
ncbi:MAG: hypothetical protein HYR85_28095 [Planctomycetes bacterium]|nr:hypothetical protein [Planctomycetota bacterium]MBI3848459.1 hypothetical protein [Planctomycetota bacterium]